MRDYLFRLWDKERNMMVYHDSDFSVLFEGRETFDELYCDNAWPSVRYFTVLGMINSLKEDFKNRIVLMPYTGVKDKSGNEIYAGDILKCFLAREVKVDSFHGYRFIYGKDLLCRAHAERGEIIGNIYENPNLLKKEAKCAG